MNTFIGICTAFKLNILGSFPEKVMSLYLKNSPSGWSDLDKTCHLRLHTRGRFPAKIPYISFFLSFNKFRCFLLDLYYWHVTFETPIFSNTSRLDLLADLRLQLTHFSAHCCASYRNRSFVLRSKTNDRFLYERKTGLKWVNATEM